MAWPAWVDTILRRFKYDRHKVTPAKAFFVLNSKVQSILSGGFVSLLQDYVPYSKTKVMKKAKN